MSSDATETEAIEKRNDRPRSRDFAGAGQLRGDPAPRSDERGFTRSSVKAGTIIAKVVNQILEMVAHRTTSGCGHADYTTTSRVAYNAASDALGRPDQDTGGNGATRPRAGRGGLPAGDLADRHRHGDSPACWWWRRSSTSAARYRVPLLHLAGCMHRLAANDTDIDIRGTERARRDRRDGARGNGVSQQCHRADGQPARARPAGVYAGGKAHRRAAPDPDAAQLRVDGVARVPHAVDHHRRPRQRLEQAQGPHLPARRSPRGPAKCARPCCG